MMWYTTWMKTQKMFLFKFVCMLLIRNVITLLRIFILLGPHRLNFYLVCYLLVLNLLVGSYTTPFSLSHSQIGPYISYHTKEFTVDHCIRRLDKRFNLSSLCITIRFELRYLGQSERGQRKYHFYHTDYG